MTTSKLRDAEAGGRDIGNQARHTKAAPRSSRSLPGFWALPLRPIQSKNRENARPGVPRPFAQRH
jgi:hypothetical protein